MTHVKTYTSSKLVVNLRQKSSTYAQSTCEISKQAECALGKRSLLTMSIEAVSYLRGDVG